MPYLVPPCIPPGSFSALDQPSVPVKGGLLLRPWRQTDAAALAAAFTDPGIQRWHVRRIDSEEEARGWITQCQERWQAETGAQWAVVPGDGGDLLGRASLRSVHLAEGRAECAYWTVPAARGSGVAVRAVSAMTHWAFEEMGFHRLELAHSVANHASCRVAAKAGFAREGTRRSAHLHTDGWHDMHLHARIREDGPAAV
ncbi:MULTISPECIES: GNAT family protein [unclassified Streptomyces]|uniref:GNAT family N-acetyltransferase n=1 Tax=Streptomyces TaxID=1883 RepID=UPI000823BA89|nr:MULTISPECIES: GNAT family protein [unclassified Streptomyces]AWN31478.1 N-acetyltransferase [Streptomyces sp. NEAU-S7GS2]MYT10926.1 GNAT family N-acetyltransferase [Streptomyces sp. SID4951]SCK05387.1 Protein N-acetyltransferase, RimJ/RimL family [Streptomyces sp. SceaMP-e96]